MDILSHGLWAGAAYKAANKTIKKRKNPFRVRLAAFWGIAPDIFSFGILVVWMIGRVIFGDLNFSDFHQAGRTPIDLERPDIEPLPGNTFFIFRLTSFWYDASHSVVVFIFIFGIAALIFKKPIWEMGGWLIHILIDIPTHSYEFYPTPFLWPVSGWKFDGFSWGNPWFMLFNYFALTVVYYLLFKKKTNV